LLIIFCAVFQPAWATLPTPSQPILVVQDASSTDPYQNYVPELLTTEGLNGFQVAQLPELTSAFLANYDVVVLPHLTLTSAQAAVFQNYVSAGGTLVGFRPDLQLANAFGVAPLGTTLNEAWFKMDTSTPSAAGLGTQLMRFHGAADLYSLNGATALAALYNNPTSPTASPAAALYSFGLGKAILFSFDLTQSVVLMRQGNPAWAGYPNNHDGFNTLRASQMFMDTASAQFWNDLGDGTLNDVPQADIQLRLFSNALVLSNAAKRPLPRLWYFPNQKRAMLLMTGDQHGDLVDNSISETNAVQSAGGKFTNFLWYPFGSISSSQVNTWLTAGHAMEIHFDGTAEVDASGVGGSGTSWTGTQNVINTAMTAFSAAYPTVAAPITTRNHFLIWLSRNAAGNPDQTAHAKLFQNAGIEFDVSYTAFPNRWGYMTGSGLPMKFLDTATGVVIPVFEQATQYEDDVQLGGANYSTQWTLATAQSHYQQSLSDSLTKYNTVITMLFHPDHWSSYSGYAQAVLQYAQSQSIPMFTTRAWLQFWKGRAATTVSMPSFTSNTLTFTAAGSPAGLTLLVPHASGTNKAVSTFLVDGVLQNFAVSTYQGVVYASVVLTAGSHNISVSYTPAGRILGQVLPTTAASSTTIQVQGGAITESVSVAADGTYTVGPLPAGTYTVTPSSSAGATFSPASRSITLSTADVSSVNFTATAVGHTLFTTQTPVSTNLNDNTNYELGTAFTSDIFGQITAVRFWKASSETGTHVGKIWSATGTLLASVTFVNETASGWQQQALDTPLDIAAATTYVVSVNTGNAFYVATNNGLASQVVNGNLRSVVGNNGVFGSSGQFPTNTGSHANYFRDIFFTPSANSLLSVSLSPSSVVGGSSSTGTVMLSSPAPAGGVTVTLTSDNPGVTVPASVTVAAGNTTATFPVNTTAVGTSTSATISGSYNGLQSAILTISRPALMTMSFSPATVAGGSSSVGTLALTGPAPAGGAVVTLSGDYPIVSGIQGVYSSAGLPAGGLLDWASMGPMYSSINSGTNMPVAGLPGVNATVSTTTGLPMMTLDNCDFGGSCGWYGNFASGASLLWMNGTYDGITGWWAPNGPLTVQFNSPQRGIGFQAMGDEMGAFTATLCAYNAANTQLGCVPFTGNGTGTADGSAAFMGLYDDALEISKVTIDAGGQIYPHDFAIGQIFVTGVRRSMIPAGVTIPAGAVTATFPVNTFPVAASTPVNITGTYVGTQTSVLTINPAALSAVTVTPNAVLGGTSLIGTATLTGSAPAGGAVVMLSADNPVATGMQTVNAPTGLPQDGSITWTDVGPSYTSVASGTPVPVTGITGTTVTASTANGGSLMVLTNCPAIADCGWSGNFFPGAPVLWVGGNWDETVTNWTGNGPLSLTLSTPQRGIGFRVMADELGAFTGTLCAYNASNTLLGCVPFGGTGTLYAGDTAGPAAYVGIYDDAAEISKVTVDAGGALYPHDFGIGQLTVATSRRMVPTSVKVQAGATTATFPVNTNTVTTSILETITGTFGTSSAATLTVSPPLTLASVTMNPTSVAGGNPSTGTLTLNGPAPTGGTVVALSDNNASSTIPASVTVAAGATSATFTVTTTAVATSTASTITATYNGSTLTAGLTINPLAITALVMNPATVGGGSSSIGTVTLNGVAPTGGAVITLSDNSASSTTPASVTVAAGATTATFTVTTISVATSTAVTITGTFNGSTQTGSLTIAPLALASVVMNPATVFGGNSSTGTVTLNGPAPAAGSVVTLSDNSASATLPASVTVAAGATSATFTATTSVVTASTPVTVTATYNGSTQTAGLAINPVLLVSLTLDPVAVVGGSSVTGTVTLNAPAVGTAAQRTVTLSDNNAAATVPASVAVTAGATTATFTITTTVVTAPTPVTVTATFNGGAQTAGLTVNPIALVSVTMNPTSVIAGTPSTGTVILSAPAAGTAAQRTVTLSSTNAAATPPATVVVAAGATGATFTVTTTAVAASTPVTITGTLNGLAQSAGLTVNPVALTSVVINPTTVFGGTSSIGTVTLNAPASGTAAQRTVTLSDNSTAANTPATVVVAAGATTATFTITTSVVTAPAAVTITATFNGAALTAGLTVNPLAIASFTMNPAVVAGGNSSIGTVTLNGPAPDDASPSGGDAVITLSDNSNFITTPTHVTIIAGATSIAFTVTTVRVTAATIATITVTYNGSTQVAQLAINPAVLASVTMNPATVVGGVSSIGTATLDGPAPTTGAVVTLSDNSTLATTPASVTVASGATTATFTVTTTSVTTSTPVTITGTFNGSTKTGSLTVNPAALASVVMNPASVFGGSSSTGTVTLNGPAPTGGAVVTLSNTNPTAATVPASVTVAAGATSVTFSATTTPVAAATSAIITATYNGTTQTATLPINPVLMASVAMNPASVFGGSSSTGTATLNGPAPTGGAVVTLSNTNTTAATVPASVTVAAGATGVTFSVTTTLVAAATSATITGSYNGSTQAATLPINPVLMASVTMNPTSVKGGTPSTGTVTLNGPAPAGGAVVTLSNTNPTAATVPASVTVAAGATSVTFSVTTTVVAVSTSATISGAYNGSTQAGGLTITP
jgi:hypothetical protein